MKVVLPVVLILLTVFPVRAFDPKTQHLPISLKALSFYEACTGINLSTEEKRAFVEGAVTEDDISIERLFNWHFYNNGKSIGRYGLFFYGANDKTFQKRLEQLETLLNENRPDRLKIYRVAGRLAHHIQDMSAPPHVMPIYHLSDDRFDHYTPSDDPVDDAAEFCPTLCEPVTAPAELLERAAQKTLERVKGRVVLPSGKTLENETWLKFWGGPDSPRLKGFKRYGVYQNNFGEMPPCPDAVCRLYDRKTYDRFFHASCACAVRDTMRLLRILDRRMQTPSGGRD